MEKKIMIQTVMSFEEFGILQDVFKKLSQSSKMDGDLYKTVLYFFADDLRLIENVRRKFLPDIKII